MKKFVASAVIAAALAAAPAAAVVFTSFAAFNGVNGNGNFSYGYTDTVVTTTFNSGTSGATCAVPGGTCLYASGPGVIPQASIGGVYPTVSVPTAAVLLHPGDAATLSVYGAFVAPTADTYYYNIAVRSVGIDTTNGTGYQAFTSLGGVVTLIGSRALLSNYQSAASLTGSLNLAAGEEFGVIIDYNGNYGGDSTKFAMRVSDVPEPATWGLMLAGFAMVGFAARRRSAVATA